LITSYEESSLGKGAACGLYYKSFTIVFNDRNGSGQSYKTFMVV